MDSKKSRLSPPPSPDETTPLNGKDELPLSGGDDDAPAPSSFGHAYLNMVKSMLGLGLFTMPFLTAKGGVVMAIVVLVIFAFVNYECVHLLAVCAAHENRRAGDCTRGSWKLVAEAAFGQPGVAVTVAVIFCTQIGVCTSYIDQLAHTFETEGHQKPTTILPVLWICLSFVAMLIKPGLREFAYVSFAGMGALLYDTVLLGYFAVDSPSRNAPIQTWVWSGMPAFLGPAIFAFECAPTALNIYTSMGQIEPDAFLRVSWCAYATGFVLILTVAIVGYLGFGDNVRRVVLFSFPNTPVGLSAQWVIDAVLFLSLNLQMMPIYQLSEDAILPALRACRGGKGGDVQTFAARFLIRSTLVGCIVLLAYVLPDVETVVGVSGAIFMTMTIAILPPIFYLKIKPDGSTFYLTAFAYCVLPVGLAIMAVGLYGQIVLINSRAGI